jgi:hypothetical protein
MMIYVLRIVVELRVELRGFEPRTFPAKTLCELPFIVPRVVTRVVRVLGVCVGALRDVTVLRVPCHRAGDAVQPRTMISPAFFTKVR